MAVTVNGAPTSAYARYVAPSCSTEICCGSTVRFCTLISITTRPVAPFSPARSVPVFPFSHQAVCTLAGNVAASVAGSNVTTLD